MLGGVSGHAAPGRNWAGNHRYRARRLHEPGSLDEVRAIVAAAARIRVLGSRHSFNDIADSAELISLARLPADVVVDRDAATVSFGAGLSYGELAVALDREGLALANLASLPHISVAGAVATATHGSGDRNGNLATAVAALELVTSGGDVLVSRRGDDGFDGLVVSLGALGAVTRLTLDVEPAYDVSQRVYEDLAWEALGERFDAITGSGYSVSLFTRWGETVEQVWVKRRDGAGDVPFDARAATADRHPVAGLDPVHTTPQLGRPGRWWDRLPHFRMGFTPSRGEELQSEFFVARADALADRRRAGAPRADRAAAVRLGDPHDRRRPAVAEPALRARQRRAALHLAAGARARGARAGRHRARARAVRRTPALGQAVPRRARRALRAPTGLHRADGPPRPAPRVPQRVAPAARAQR
jgi:xylitol oxidase